MATIRDLITRHLRLMEELGAGETATAEDCADALVALNAMLDSWSVQGDLVYTETKESFTLTANDGEYTLGPTGNFVTSRPTEIIAITVNDGVSDETLTRYSTQEWADIPEKTLQGDPEVYHFDGNFPNGTLKLYPVPDSADTITIYSEKPLSSYSTINDSFIAPPGYEDAIVYNLTVRRAPEYGKEASNTVKSIAREAKNAIVNNNSRTDNDKLSVDDALMSTGGFDVYSGRFK